MRRKTRNEGIVKYVKHSPKAVFDQTKAIIQQLIGNKIDTPSTTRNNYNLNNEQTVDCILYLQVSMQKYPLQL